MFGYKIYLYYYKVFYLNGYINKKEKVYGYLIYEDECLVYEVREFDEYFYLSNDLEVCNVEEFNKN